MCAKQAREPHNEGAGRSPKRYFEIFSPLWGKEAMRWLEEGWLHTSASSLVPRNVPGPGLCRAQTNAAFTTALPPPWPSPASAG